MNFRCGLMAKLVDQTRGQPPGQSVIALSKLPVQDLCRFLSRVAVPLGTLLRHASMISRILGLLLGTDIKVRAEKSRVDDRTSVFRLNWYLVRIIRDGLSADLRVDEEPTFVSIYPESLDCWRALPYEMPANGRRDLSQCVRPILEEERKELVALACRELRKTVDLPIVGND